MGSAPLSQTRHYLRSTIIAPCFVKKSRGLLALNTRINSRWECSAGDVVNARELID